MFRPTDILDRTEKGSEELRTRKDKLPGKLRMLLLLIDGKHPAFIVLEHAEKLKLSRESIEQLIEGGYVQPHREAPVPATMVAGESDGAEGSGSSFYRYTTARRLMNESVFSALGLRSFMFTLKLERTGNLEDLRRLLPDYERAMGKAVSAEAVAIFLRRLEDLLNVQ